MSTQLADIPWLLQLLGPERLDGLRPHLRRSKFQDREFLYHEGEPARALWSVISGEVRTLKVALNGRVTTLESHHPGDLFGLASLGPDAPYPETAQGIGSGEVWRVPRKPVVALLDADPELTRQLLGIVAARLHRAHERVCSFAQSVVPARLARVVLDAADGDRIGQTRQLLAESAGTTVETTIRVLRRFENAGWIEGGVGWVRILDAGPLEQVARGEDPASDL